MFFLTGQKASQALGLQEQGLYRFSQDSGQNLEHRSSAGLGTGHRGARRSACCSMASPRQRLPATQSSTGPHGNSTACRTQLDMEGGQHKHHGGRRRAKGQLSSSRSRTEGHDSPQAASSSASPTGTDGSSASTGLPMSAHSPASPACQPASKSENTSLFCI